tara:strand:- start:15300 stop:15662 length:363 start_codon:yes stop_codon:yes gene_type:complete
VIQNTLNIIIASVWVINGLISKVFGLTPRHEAIVARILGTEFAHPLTILIGISEIFMAIWVLSKFRAKLNAYAQIFLVSTMNILETILAPDLLLWGQWNLLWAITFCLIIWKNHRLAIAK